MEPGGLAPEKWYVHAFYWYLLAPEGSAEEALWLTMCEHWQTLMQIDELLAETNGEIDAYA